MVALIESIRITPLSGHDYRLPFGVRSTSWDSVQESVQCVKGWMNHMFAESAYALTARKGYAMMNMKTRCCTDKRLAPIC